MLSNVKKYRAKMTKTQPELLTVKEASRLLNCHPNTLRQWEAKGLIKSMRFGIRKDRRFLKSDLLNLVNRTEPKGALQQTLLPSDYDLTRIDMTGTYYEGLDVEALAAFKSYKELENEIIKSFEFKKFIADYNRRIQYFEQHELNKYKTLSEKILHIVTSKRYRNGSLETINLAKHGPALLKKIESWISKNKPIEFMLPAFPFKIANPLKSSRRDADLAEIGAFCNFNEINLQIKKVYKPGAKFIVFHDGHLYYRHFLHQKEDADRYFKSLQRFIRELGIGNVVVVRDAFEELKHIQNFLNVYKTARKEMENLWEKEKYSNQKIQKIIKSSKANLNLSNIPYMALYRINFMEDWDLSEEEKALKKKIDERAEKCAFEYMTVQHALEKVNFFDARVPNGIRITVHPKEGQIGVYLVKKKTYLLPWMGAGVLKNNGEISVHYESELLSSRKHYPLFIKGEKFPFYYKEAEVIYEGADEFKKLFDCIIASLTKKDFYWAFAFNSEYFNEKIRALLREVHAKLEEIGVQDRAICRKEMVKTIRDTYKLNKNIQIKSTDEDIPSGMIVLKDRVISLLWGEVPSAFEIKTPEIINRYQKYFQEVWKRS
jgi:excisionase family DNA binding protein